MLRLIFGMIPFLLSMALDSAGDNSDASDSDDTDDATGKKGGSDSRTFTQEEVDALIDARVTRSKSALTREVEDELREKWEDEQKRKQQEEQQEYKPLYEKALEDKTAAERKADEVAGQFRTRLAKVEIEKAATEARLAAPQLAHRLIDFEQITFNEEGTPTNIPDLVTSLATANPDLVKPEEKDRNGIKPAPGGDNVQRTREDIKNDYLKKAGVQV